MQDAIDMTREQPAYCDWKLFTSLFSTAVMLWVTAEEEGWTVARTASIVKFMSTCHLVAIYCGYRRAIDEDRREKFREFVKDALMYEASPTFIFIIGTQVPRFHGSVCSSLHEACIIWGSMLLSIFLISNLVDFWVLKGGGCDCWASVDDTNEEASTLVPDHGEEGDRGSSFVSAEGMAWDEHIREEDSTASEANSEALSRQDRYGLFPPLDDEGGATVDGKKYEEKECYENAPEIDSEDAGAWYNLGAEGFGTIPRSVVQWFTFFTTSPT